MTERIINIKSIDVDEIREMDLDEDDRMWMELTKQFGGSVIHFTADRILEK